MAMIGEDAIAVFTARSPKRVIAEGGSQAWILNPTRAKLCRWLVCTQNLHNPDHEFSDATEPHGSAFLIGKISRIREADPDNDSERWMIEISEYALVEVPDVWKGWRNPVRYTTVASLGIDPEKLTFKPLEKNKEIPEGEGRGEAPSAPSAPRGMTIPEAKKALAITFGVSPDAVEITIRG